MKNKWPKNGQNFLKILEISPKSGMGSRPAKDSCADRWLIKDPGIFTLCYREYEKSRRL